MNSHVAIFDPVPAGESWMSPSCRSGIGKFAFGEAVQFPEVKKPASPLSTICAEDHSNASGINREGHVATCLNDRVIDDRHILEDVGVISVNRPLQRTAYGYRDQKDFRLKLHALHTIRYAIIGLTPATSHSETG